MRFTTGKKEEKEEIVRLWLGETDVNVNLMGEDCEGMDKVIMSFSNGKFYRCLSAELEGIETDESGRIIEE